MFPDFFMHIGQALDLVSRYDSLRNPLTSLGDYLCLLHTTEAR
ncbi:transposase, partial [Shigella sonnei]